MRSALRPPSERVTALLATFVGGGRVTVVGQDARGFRRPDEAARKRKTK